MAKTVRITEPTWRKIDRLLKDEQASRTVLPLTGAGTNIIRVRNNTADIINRFGALGVSGSVIEMAPENSSHHIIVDGYTPSAIDHANGKFVICAEPIQSGRIGRAYAAGVTAAIVNVVDESHTYADIDDGQYCLKSAESGTCAILWKESGTGQLLAIVRFGGAGSVGTSIRKAYCLTAGGVGNTINCTLDLDASEAAAWASHIIYSEGDQVAHNNKIWQSLIDDNQGNEPGVDDGWVNIQVVVFCSVIGEAGLADCFPTLSAGTMMPVWYDNRDGKWRSLWWFQGHEQCPE